jgi:transposase
VTHDERHIQLARNLRAKHAWSTSRIAKHMRVEYRVVHGWLNQPRPSELEAREMWARALKYRRGGMTYGGIKVMFEQDYGVVLSRESISKRLRSMGCPKDLRHGRPFGHSQCQPQEQAA